MKRKERPPVDRGLSGTAATGATPARTMGSPSVTHGFTGR